MADYLRLIAGLCRVQQQVLDDPPLGEPLDRQRIELCQQHGLPPFAADSLAREDDWQLYLDALLQRYGAPPQSAVAEAVDTLRLAQDGYQRLAPNLLLAPGDE